MPMTSSSDAAPAPESSSYSHTPFDLASRQAARPLTPHQEINERRARVENPELLRHLRGL
jgi:hypothetical protein